MPRGSLSNFGARKAPPFTAKAKSAPPAPAKRLAGTGMMRRGDNVAGPRGRTNIPAPVRSVHGVKTVNTRFGAKGGK